MNCSFFKRSSILWIVAVLMTLGSVVYQRITGPTHPYRGQVTINNSEIKYKLLKSHETTADARMVVILSEASISGEITYRRFKSHDDWTTLAMEKYPDSLEFSIPRQPAAGKVIYQASLIDAQGEKYPLTDQPIVIRFRDPVPLPVLLLHIVVIFGAMLYASRTGLEAVVSGSKMRGYTLITIILLFIGGLFLGPLVQKYAFGAYWTGWPFGHDLTDNKTALAMFFWAIALWRIKKPDCRKWVIIASLVTLLVFLIPHSVLGSELDYR